MVKHFNFEGTTLNYAGVHQTNFQVKVTFA